jgi:hypothetical protein
MRPRPTRAWTDAEAIEAVRQWATGHGGYPPHTADFASDPTLPSRTYVLRHFGGLASLRVRAGLAPGASGHGGMGSALHVMLFLANLIRALLIFNGLRSRHYQRALLGYHYRPPKPGQPV